MSAKYVVMDTEKLVNYLLSLTSKGEPVFELREIRNNRSKKGAGRGVHTVKLQMRVPYQIGKDIVYLELIIMNSHDGSSPLRVEIGIFRQVCTNGLCVKMKDLGEIIIRHMGTPQEAAFQIVKEMAAQLPQVINAHAALTKRILSEEETIEFAMKAAQVRWNREFTPEDAKILLEVARPEDAGMNMWEILNRVQEKVVNGGIKLTGMKRHAKAIIRGAEDVRVNGELFKIASEYCEFELMEN
jgi:hypothetical protein